MGTVLVVTEDTNCNINTSVYLSVFSRKVNLKIVFLSNAPNVMHLCAVLSLIDKGKEIILLLS